MSRCVWWRGTTEVMGATMEQETVSAANARDVRDAAISRGDTGRGVRRLRGALNAFGPMPVVQMLALIGLYSYTALRMILAVMACSTRISGGTWQPGDGSCSITRCR